jgi:hypothetical protein
MFSPKSMSNVGFDGNYRCLNKNKMVSKCQKHVIKCNSYLQLLFRTQAAATLCPFQGF